MSDSPKTVMKVRPKGAVMMLHLRDLLPLGAHFQTAGGRVSVDGQGWFTLTVDTTTVADIRTLLAENDWEIQEA